MIRKIISGLFLACVVCASCKKENGTNRPNAEPVKTGKGVAIGSPVSASIGAAGGELISGDGKLKITVPPGAVASNTTFTIQPITNTLFEGDNRTAYRLLPEGTHFSKPVQIQVHYAAEDTVNTTEDALVIASQRADGAWVVSPTQLDKTAKKLTVETTHFSDWTITGGLYLWVEKPELGLGEKTMIKVVSVFEYDDDVLAPLLPTLNSVDVEKLESIDNWKMVNGIGSIGVETGQLGKLQTEAEYRAPADMTPARRTMIISVDAKGFNLIKDPAATGGVRKLNKLILLGRITVVKEYIKAVIGGTTYMINGTDAVATTSNGALLIGGRNSTIDLTLNVLGTSAGTYNCNNDNGVQVYLNNSTQPFSTFYMKCAGAGIGYSAAPIEITKAGGRGELVSGRFIGSLFNNQANACAGPVPTVAVDIEFHLTRRN